MTSSQVPSANGTSEPEEDLAQLQDLEQHISQRILKLGDDGLGLPGLEADLFATGEPTVILPFEEEEPFDFLDSAKSHYAGVYQSMPGTYQSSNELIRTVHDLSDHVTESILNLNIRLTGLEDNLGQRFEADALELNKSLRDFKKLLEQKGVNLPKDTPGKTADDSEQLNLALQEIKTQLKLLEARIETLAQESKKPSENKQTAPGDQLDQRLRAVERSLSQNREYFNRHFFSLAVLIIMLMFIGGALITSSVDRLCNYMTHQMEALQSAVDAGSSNHKLESESAFSPR